MAYEVEPISSRWREIVAEPDERKQSRMLRQYVYELEKKVGARHYELEDLKEENEKLKKDIQKILSLNCVKEAINEKVKAAEENSFRYFNSRWDEGQGGS